MIRLWKDSIDSTYCFADHVKHRASRSWADTIPDAVSRFYSADKDLGHTVFTGSWGYICIAECESIDDFIEQFPELLV